MPDGDDQALSSQDIQDLQDITSRLPAGHPMQKKISILLNAQPTQFEKQREGGPDSGFLSGVKSSLGTPPSFKEQIPGLLLGPGYNAAKGLYSTIKNAPANIRAGVQSADVTSPGGTAPADVRGFVGAASAIGPLLGIDPQNMAERAERGDTSGILGEAAIPTALAAIPLAKEGTKAVREGIGGAIRTPEGALKPGAKVTSQLGGAAIGGAAGELIHPGYGGVAGLGAGYKAGPLVAEKLFPEPPSRVAARAATAEQSDIQAGLQQRRAAYAEMNEDFANRAKQQQADMQKRIAASEKRISAAEDARQKEITDWAKVDKINDADHQTFQDRMAEIEQERQKALADTEKLRTQHAQDLQNRGNQQAAMDASHAQDLADIEKARQGDLAAQERLKLQHAEALNQRKGAKASPTPPPNPFAGMTSSAAPIGNATLPPAPSGPAPATIRMGTGVGAEGLAAQPAPVTGRPGGLTPPPTPTEMPEPAGAPLSRPTVGSEISARNKSQGTLLSRGRELYQPGEEPDLNNPAHAKIIGQLQTRSGPELRTMAKAGDRFAAFVLRNMPRP